MRSGSNYQTQQVRAIPEELKLSIDECIHYQVDLAVERSRIVNTISFCPLICWCFLLAKHSWKLGTREFDAICRDQPLRTQSGSGKSESGFTRQMERIQHISVLILALKSDYFYSNTFLTINDSQQMMILSTRILYIPLTEIFLVW